MSFWITGAVGGYQVISGFQQGAAIRENADAKSNIDKFNAKWAAVDAYNTENQGISEGARYQTQVDKTVGTQQVAYASQGVDIGYGSASQVQEETKLQGMINVFDIQKAARAKAKGYMNQSNNDSLQSTIDTAQGDMNARATENAGIIGGLNTGLSGYRYSVPSLRRK